MLSFRAWLALLLFYLMYLLLGGYIFYLIEEPNDCINVQKNYNKSQELNQLVEDIRNGNLTETQNKALKILLNKIADLFESNNVGIQISNLGSPPNCSHFDTKWNFYNSLFFSFTAITTIGYGHLSPDTDTGKLICMVYSLLGVPINGIFIAAIGAYFKNRLKNFISKQSAEGDATNLLVLVFQVLMYLIFGHVVFIFIPAVAIKFIEDWSYLDSVYFAFITLTTIGFGDLVAGRSRETLESIGSWEYVYLGGVFVWIVFGLGYIFMIIGVIADGLKKPVRRAAKTLDKAAEAFMDKVMAEILRKKEQYEEDGAKEKIVVHTPNGDSIHCKTDTADVGAPASISKGFENPAYNPSPIHTSINENVLQSNEGSEVQVLELIEEMNHDTITSLHNFVESAQYVKSRTGHNASSTSKPWHHHQNRNPQVRLPQVSSRSSSFSGVERNHCAVQRNQSSSDHCATTSSRAASIHGGETEVRRGNHAWSFVRELSFRNVEAPRENSAPESETYGTFVKKFQNRKTSVSLPEILRQTTMEEFLEAVERVQASQLLTEDFSGSNINSDECDDETCQDLSEINENTHTQIDTAPSFRARRSSNSNTENQCIERTKSNGASSGNDCLV